MNKSNSIHKDKVKRLVRILRFICRDINDCHVIIKHSNDPEVLKERTELYMQLEAMHHYYSCQLEDLTS